METIFENSKQLLPYFFGLVFLVENVVFLFKHQSIFNTETKVNLLTGVLSFATTTFLKTFFMYSVFPVAYLYRFFTIDNVYLSCTLAFILFTFIQFSVHYLNHRIRLFWCIHEVHHSVTQMNVSMGLRTSIFDIMPFDVFYLIIPLLGIHPLYYFFIYVISKFWGTFIHLSEHVLKLRSIFNKIIVTPTVHHIHHASNTSYLDKNFGEMIPWFDLLFGTYSSINEPIVYGTAKVQTYIGFWEAQTHEFKALIRDIKGAENWKIKLKYMFMPPNWQP